MEVQPPELANCGATCGVARQPLQTEVRVLKRLRTDKSDAEDHVPAPASRTSAASAVQQSEQEACDNPPVKAVKQDQAGPSDPHTVAQEPTANDGAHVDQEPAAHPASEQEPSTGPCSGQSPTANEAASSRDAQPQQPCNNRVLLEPHLLLQQYVELLRSQHPQHVLQALNPLLLLSRNEVHARVLSQYPPLFPALFSAIHSFHVAVDCHLLRCESSRTATLAHSVHQPATTVGPNGADCLAGREGTDEADPASVQEGGQACAAPERAETTPEEAWQAQLAVAAATVVHHLAMVSGSHMSPESIAGVHIICLQHLALLNAQPWQPVLEVGLLLLSAARATIKSAAAPSSFNLCEHLLRVISDPSTPVQVKSLACSIVVDALASNQRQPLIRHLTVQRPREPFEAAVALLRNNCKASHVAHMLPQNQPHQFALQGHYVQCMSQLWQIHLVSCGVRLARELLVCTAAGHVNVTVTSNECNSMERISRTFKLCPPSLHLCAPVSPTLRNFTLRHRVAARGGASSSCAAVSGCGRNGVAAAAQDRASPFSDVFADAPSSTQQYHISSNASPAASAPTTPRGTRSQLVHSFPRLGCTGTDASAPSTTPAPAANAANATLSASTAAPAAPSTETPAPPQVKPAASVQPCVNSGDNADNEAHPFAVPPTKEEPEKAAILADVAANEKAAILADVPSRDVPRPEIPFQPALSVEVEGTPGSPSLSMDNMPSFSRWVSMSLSRSISFGGPRGADAEVPDSTLCSFGDAACGGSSGAAGGGAESVHSHGAASPTIRATVASQLSRPIMAALPQISLAPPLPSELHMDNGVTGSCDTLPDMPMGADATCGQSGDTLHVPPLLMKTLCDVAASAVYDLATPDAANSTVQHHPSLPSQASLSTQPAAAATSPPLPNGFSTHADVKCNQPEDKPTGVDKDVAPATHANEALTPVNGAAPAAPVNDAGAGGSTAGVACAGSTSEGPGMHAAQAGAVVSSTNVESGCVSEKKSPGCATEGSTEVAQLQALLYATTQQVAQAAEQVLAIAGQVPELAAQVPKQTLTCPEARVRELYESTGPLHLTSVDSSVFAGLVNLSRGVAGTAVALDFPQ